MQAKVHTEDAGNAVPMAWRNRSVAQVAITPGPAGKSDAEVVMLRGRLDEMNIEMQQQVRQAFEAGLREGGAAVRRDLENEVRGVIGKLSAAIDEVASGRNEAIRQAETDMVRLSIGIARRILHRELALDAAALEGLIKAALEKLRSQDLYRVRVHPQHEQLVRLCLQKIGRNPDMEVIGDASQPLGAAIFEISRGFLDASIETQLGEIERGLESQLGERE